MQMQNGVAMATQIHMMAAAIKCLCVYRQCVQARVDVFDSYHANMLCLLMVGCKVVLCVLGWSLDWTN